MHAVAHQLTVRPQRPTPLEPNRARDPAYRQRLETFAFQVEVVLPRYRVAAAAEPENEVLRDAIEDLEAERLIVHTYLSVYPPGPDPTGIPPSAHVDPAHQLYGLPGPRSHPTVRADVRVLPLNAVSLTIALELVKIYARARRAVAVDSAMRAGVSQGRAGVRACPTLAARLPTLTSTCDAVVPPHARHSLALLVATASTNAEVRAFITLARDTQATACALLLVPPTLQRDAEFFAVAHARESPGLLDAHRASIEADGPETTRGDPPPVPRVPADLVQRPVLVPGEADANRVRLRAFYEAAEQQKSILDEQRPPGWRDLLSALEAQVVLARDDEAAQTAAAGVISVQ